MRNTNGSPVRWIGGAAAMVLNERDALLLGTTGAIALLGPESKEP